MKEHDLRQMNLRPERVPGTGEFLLAEGFVLRELARLSGEAVKLYLLLLYHSQKSQLLPERKELLQTLNFDLAEYKGALNELLQKAVLRLEGNSYYLADLRFTESSNPQPAESSAELNLDLEKGQGSSISSPQPDLVQEREDAIKQINDSFFQGVMPTGLYHIIDHWFSEYKFSPHVIYAIFSEAEQNQAVNNTSYVRAIADNWHHQGIREYEDLNNYLRRREEMFGAGELVRKRLKLRGNLTHYQEELVDKWVNQWKFSNEIIDRALGLTVKITNPNLDYVDKVLKTWHEVGIKDLAGLERYLDHWDKRKKKQAPRSAEPIKRQNFAGRQDSNYAALSSRRWRRSTPEEESAEGEQA
ncbi:MAG: DnaD domain protein [Eubacteriales bacterium]|nr:DnaD domain protein [Eubacteriales bacterium]